MAKATSTHDLSEATIEMQTGRAGLKYWFQNAADAQYYPFKVKVLGRKKGPKSDKLRFVLADDGAPDTEFEVDLVTQTDLVWPNLPSTAQAFKRNGPPYGFLMLSKRWIDANQVDMSIMEGGGKFPISSGL